MDPAHKHPLAVIPPCMLVVAISYGLSRYSLGLFLPVIREDLNLSIKIAGLIVSSSYVGYLLATILASLVAGRVGPRILVFAGGFLATTGLAIIGTNSSSWLVGFGIFIAGMSPGLIYPPLSDAITRLVRDDQRDWVYSVVNSGTSIGIMLCVPLAFLLSDRWPVIYLSFAGFSAFVTLWATMVVPSGPFLVRQNTAVISITANWLVNKRSSSLFLSSFLFGIATSAPWTFTPDLLKQSGAQSNDQIAIFWFLIGFGGLFGGVAAKSIGSVGLNKSLLAGLVVLLICTLLPALFSACDPVVMIAAFLFGASFIMVTGLYGVWSMYVFHERPSAGFGLVFLVISLGQFLGTVTGGFSINVMGYIPTFMIAAAIGALPLILLPRDVATYQMREDAVGGT